MDPIVIPARHPQRWIGIAMATLLVLIAFILAVPEARFMIMYVPLILLSGLAIPVTPISGSPQMTIGEEGIDAGEGEIIRWKDIDRATVRRELNEGGLLNLVLRDGRKNLEMRAETALILLLLRERVPVRVTRLGTCHPAYRVLVILLNLLSFGLFVGALVPAIRLLAGDGDPTGPGVMTGMILGSFVGWSLAALLALCNRFGVLDRWNKGFSENDQHIEVSAWEVLRSESVLKLGGDWVFAPIERRANEIQKARQRIELWFLALAIVFIAGCTTLDFLTTGFVAPTRLMALLGVGLFIYLPIHIANRIQKRISLAEERLLLNRETAVIEYGEGETRQIPTLELCKLASSSESTDGFWLRRLFLTEWKTTPLLPSSLVVRFGPDSSREPVLECD